MSEEAQSQNAETPASGDAGKTMHIHRPRPLHGARDILTEIGVVVVGIAIAIGGEQVVEWLHWNGVVAETRQALNRELAGDLGVVQARIDQGPCIARRLSQLTTVFRLHAKGLPLRLKGPLGQPQFPLIQSSVWETALASQGAAHMPLDMKLRYASMYASLYWFRDRTTDESEAWSHLSQFDDQEVMTEPDWSALRQWKARAQAVEEKVDANSSPFISNGMTIRPWFDQAAVLGVKAEPFHFRTGSQAARDALCRPLV